MLGLIRSESIVELDKGGLCLVHEAEIGKWLKENCAGEFRTVVRGNIYPEPTLESLTSSRLRPGIARVCLYTRVCFDEESDAVAFTLWLDRAKK